jgi:hypothetical protein
LVTKRGGIGAACDTDGAYIVATQEGGTVYVETRGDKYYEGGQAQPAHALSYSEVENIAALFEPLNPFDRALLPGAPLRVNGASEGLFISAKRYALTGADGDFIDRKESILGMLLAPCGGWVDEAWRTIGEIWDHHRRTPRSWFTLPAVRCLSLTSPGYSREMKALVGMRPWNSFLVAIAIGHDPSDPVPKTAVVVAPYERDPEKWEALDWRFGDNGKPILVNRPDSDGVRWRLRTMQQFLQEYAHHPTPKMLAPDGSRCRAYTRGVLLRRPIRDGERWLILKEVALWGDDPRRAFSVPQPEKVRAGRSMASADWDSKIKTALKVVGTAAVARKMGLAERSARAWTGGEHQPEDPAKVARAIVAVAREAALTLPIDEHHRAEEICGELPCRATAVQAFIAITAEMLAERHGGVRALARAMARENGPGPEATVRRWLALGQSELRSILELNRIGARLAKFSRSEIRKVRRRIRSESGPAGDRQAVLAYISLLKGAGKPVLPTPEETLVLPLVLVVTKALAGLVCQVAERLRAEVRAPWAPSSMPQFPSPPPEHPNTP